MKKSAIVFLGILLGSIFMSRHAIAQPVQEQEMNPVTIELPSTELQVFPNPSDGRFRLTMEYGGVEKVTAKVFDITGKLIKDISEDLVKGDTNLEAYVDLESPSSGIYFLRLEIGKKLITKKIIVR